MGLTEYKRKRHFQRTPEPAGKRAARNSRQFVVQKHDASHLHYDFRLELDGVLKSWAVPKGPSLDPSVKRLAMHVEDHPVEYGKFEGTIPQGEYGGGTVMLWDRGQWEPLGNAAKDYQAGRLKFQLHGEKLHGGWMLVRTGGKSDRDERRWLLFKERDQAAKSEGDILDEMPLSVSTGRDLDEIAAKAPVIKAKAKTKAKSARLPSKIEVQLATLTKDAPDGEDWLHEIKYDGYRMICRIEKSRAAFLSRNHQDWTHRLKSLAERAKKLGVREAILDGEVVALRPDGTTHFQDLQNAFRDGSTADLHYFVFDLLHLDGQNLATLPLTERKAILKELLSRRGTPASIQYSEHLEGDGPAFLREACKNGLEGIISKRADRPYTAGRGLNWLKLKCVKHDEFVIGGYTEPSGSRAGFGAILVGYHRDGKLLYAGKVGTGFDDKTLNSLRKQFAKREQKQSPFADRKRAPRHWVRPELVAQIAYGSRTREGILRHAAFQGLREDKPAGEVTEEKAVSKAASKPVAADYDAKKEQFAGVRLTSPDKILDAESGSTKLDLARYYRDTAEWILPHIANRPLVLVRCPDGQGNTCFYQKHPVAGTPETLRRIPIEEKKGTEDYVIADDVAGLISLAQIGAFEIHAWGSREDKLDYPDRLIFDLDPDPSVPWPRVVECGRQVREFLQELGLESFVRLTGGKGLHLVVPIERRHDWKQAKAFCKQVADSIVAADPSSYTANMSKAVRRGKIFVDYLRNDRGSTAIVSYSTRAKPGMPVAVPITWNELSARVPSNHYTLATLAQRLDSFKRDPWEKLASTRQSLTKPLKTLKSLTLA